MGRPETPIDSDAGPLHEFATRLRRLRAEAGSPSYRWLSRRTHFSASTLARAADGKRLPSLDVMLAYVRACGGDEDEWRGRWHSLLRDPVSAPDPDSAPASAGPAPARRPTPVPRHLPRDVPDFVGREAEFRVVSQRVGRTPAATPVIAVSGLPGVGKTAFAVRAARLLADVFPDGQLFCDLRGVDDHPVPPERVLVRFARSLGFAADAPGDLDELAAVYRSMLNGRRCLILLDNAAHEEQVRPLIPAEPACLVLITSRSRLAGLPGAAFVALDPLHESEALRLLAGIAEPPAGRHSPSREIVQLCGGLPLALRIVGAQLATGASVSAGRLADRLRAQESRLARLEAGDLAVRSTFALSYLALPPQARLVFRRLGIFPGPAVTPDIAAPLAGLTPEAAEEALTVLQQRSMLSAADGTRYQLHDLLRLYAGERCREEDTAADRAAAALRLVSWLLSVLTEAAAVISPNGWHANMGPFGGDPVRGFSCYDDALAWLDAEHATLTTAISWAAEAGLHQYAWRLAAHLWCWFNLRGRPAEWKSAAMTGLSSARALCDPDAEAFVLQSLAIARHRTREFAAAMDAQQRALSLFRASGNRMAQARALCHLGITHCLLGDHGRAINVLSEAARLHAELRDPYGAGLAYSNIAWAYDDFAADPEQAIAWCGKALAAFGDDPYGRSLVLTNLASAHRHLGQVPEAIACAEQAVAAHQRTGHREGQAIAHEHLAEALADAGRTVESREQWALSLALYQRLDDPRQDRVSKRLAGT